MKTTKIVVIVSATLITVCVAFVAGLITGAREAHRLAHSEGLLFISTVQSKIAEGDRTGLDLYLRQRAGSHVAILEMCNSKSGKVLLEFSPWSDTPVSEMRNLALAKAVAYYTENSEAMDPAYKDRVAALVER